MELKAMFPNLNVMWTRWSDYEVTDWEGIEYLVPAKAATALTYNCAEQPETMVADALELGRQLCLGAPDKIRLCADFAARHGLLGLETDSDTYSTDPTAPPSLRPLNSQKYGEDLEGFQESFVELYQHFLSVRGELAATPNQKVLDLSGELKYRLTGGQSPQLVWQVESMKAVLHFTYAALITSDKPILKVCKNCGKVYYNTHVKSEFCGTKCRNYYNVKVFREREKM